MRTDRDWSKLRGFNYQPSYGSSGFELWRRFDAKTIEVELARGKRYFPGMNALRWWQSWDAYIRDPKKYLRDFETTLQLAEAVGCPVMPVLFNRWHEHTLDYGGIYTEHFFPFNERKGSLFIRYLQDLVGGHKDDPRILAWDLCNEPQLCAEDASKDIFKSELAWLTFVYDSCKSIGAAAPLTVGTIPFTPLELMDPICDVFSIHPYWAKSLEGKFESLETGRDFRILYDKAAFEEKLDADAAFARSKSKPLIATECCWGDFNDDTRVAGIRYTLEQLEKRDIGWTVYLLHHSLIADAHRPEFGPVGIPENLAFIEVDGSLRRGHEVFNQY